MRDALRAVLDPLRLDYAVQGDRIRISTPERVQPPATPRGYTPGPEPYFVDSGVLNVAGETIALGDTDASVRSKRLLRLDNVRLLSAPQMLVLKGREASINIRDEEPLEFFVPKSGDDESEFLLAKSDWRTGVALTVKFVDAPDDAVRMDVAVETTYVEGREPLPGTALNVGMPRFKVDEAGGRFTPGLGRRAAMIARIGDNDSDILLTLFRVTHP